MYINNCIYVIIYIYILIFYFFPSKVLIFWQKKNKAPMDSGRGKLPGKCIDTLQAGRLGDDSPETSHQVLIEDRI
jgi:hypothetical protein